MGWKSYPKRSPKKDGSYLVTIEKPNSTRKTFIIYFSTKANTWILVPEGFSVVYWKKLPKPCWRHFKLTQEDLD